MDKKQIKDKIRQVNNPTHVNKVHAVLCVISTEENSEKECRDRGRITRRDDSDSFFQDTE